MQRNGDSVALLGLQLYFRGSLADSKPCTKSSNALNMLSWRPPVALVILPTTDRSARRTRITAPVRMHVDTPRHSPKSEYPSSSPIKEFPRARDSSGNHRSTVERDASTFVNKRGVPPSAKAWTVLFKGTCIDWGRGRAPMASVHITEARLRAPHINIDRLGISHGPSRLNRTSKSLRVPPRPPM